MRCGRRRPLPASPALARKGYTSRNASPSKFGEANGKAPKWAGMRRSHPCVGTTQVIPPHHSAVRLATLASLRGYDAGTNVSRETFWCGADTMRPRVWGAGGGVVTTLRPRPRNTGGSTKRAGPGRMRRWSPGGAQGRRRARRAGSRHGEGMPGSMRVRVTRRMVGGQPGAPGPARWGRRADGVATRRGRSAWAAGGSAARRARLGASPRRGSSLGGG